MPEIAINSGAGPVANATEENAATNMEVRRTPMTEINSDLMDEVISQATVAADMAVIDAHRDGTIKTAADASRIAVRAAIRNVVGNGALQLTPDADQVWLWRMGDPDTWSEEDTP